MLKIKHLHGQHTSSAKQWGADVYQSCQYSTFFFPVIHYSLSTLEKGTSTPLLRYPDSFSEFKHLDMINCSAPLVRVEIYQYLLNVFFHHARKGQSRRIIPHRPRKMPSNPSIENNIIHILNSWYQTEGILHCGANYSTFQGLFVVNNTSSDVSVK